MVVVRQRKLQRVYIHIRELPGEFIDALRRKALNKTDVFKIADKKLMKNHLHLYIPVELYR